MKTRIILLAVLLVACGGIGGGCNSGGGRDNQAPSVPTGLQAVAVSASRINLSWNAATDNVGVAGYKIYRDGTQINSATTSYSDTGLTSSTTYAYAVSAYDAAGNESGRSLQASAATLAPWKGVKVFGTTADDTVTAVATDQTGIFVAGQTRGSWPGYVNRGGLDVFLLKIDPAGNLKWAWQKGDVSDDYAAGLSLSLDGKFAYLLGYSQGSMVGKPINGGVDPFLIKIDITGIPVEVYGWQKGTPNDDVLLGITFDTNGDILLAGATQGSWGNNNQGGWDALIVRLRDMRTEFKELQAWQFGGPSDEYCTTIAVSDNYMFVGGATFWEMDGLPNRGGVDTFLRKMDLAGNKVWTWQGGSPEDDYSLKIAIDGKNKAVYLAGNTSGVMGQKTFGSADAFLKKFADLGSNSVKEEWTLQYGGIAWDSGNDVAVDPNSGAVYFSGTFYDIFGSRWWDVFVAEVNPATGEVLWDMKVGSPTFDDGGYLALDPQGNPFLTGSISAIPGQTSFGGLDAGVWKFDPNGVEQ